MDPQDVEIAKLKEEDVGRPFLRGPRALPPEADPYTEEVVSKFNEKNDIPMTAYRLGYGDKISIDPAVEMKVRAIDEYLQDQMKKEGFRDSKTGFETAFRRMAEQLSLNPEAMKNYGDIKKMTDSMFMHVAFSKGMSSQSYLNQFSSRYQADRVQGMLGQLGKVLNTLSKTLKN